MDPWTGAEADQLRPFVDVAVPPVGDATVTVGDREDLLTERSPLESWRWMGEAADGRSVELQCAAHGRPEPGRIEDGAVWWERPHRRVAAGQSIVAYDGEGRVVGGGVAARQPA